MSVPFCIDIHQNMIHNIKMIIYCATCQANQKKYIGQTIKTLPRRISNHKDKSKKRNNTFIFYNAIRKHGWDNFTWEVLDTATTLEELNTLEIHYIREYQTYPPSTGKGYNMTTGGGSYDRCDETKVLTSSTMRGTTEPMILMKGGVTYTFDNISEFCREHTLTISCISLVLRGNAIQHNGFHLPTNNITKELMKDGVLYRFTMVSEFCRQYNIKSESAIYRVVSGKKLHHQGYHLPENRGKKIRTRPS